MNALYNRIRGKGVIVCITDFTVLNVIFYKRGRTAHFIFNIFITDCNIGLLSKISIYLSRAQLLRYVLLLIWKKLFIIKKTAIKCAE